MSDKGEYKAPQVIILPIWFVFSAKLNLLNKSYIVAPQMRVQRNALPAEANEAINAPYVNPTLIR